MINGRVSYIDPQLNEETQTGRLRIEVANANERLKAGMFVEVGFQAGTGSATGEELVFRRVPFTRSARKPWFSFQRTVRPGPSKFVRSR